MRPIKNTTVDEKMFLCNKRFDGSCTMASNSKMCSQHPHSGCGIISFHCPNYPDTYCMEVT